MLDEKPAARKWWTNTLHAVRNLFIDAAKRSGVDLGRLQSLGAEDYIKGVAEQMALGRTLNEHTARGKYARYAPPGSARATDGGGTRYARRKDVNAKSRSAAVESLRDLADGEEFSTIHNARYGDIRYPFGRLGKNGFGFQHIVESRMAKDGASLEDAVDVAMRVAESAEDGIVTKERYNTRHFDKNGIRAIVAFDRNGNSVITGYEISADASGGAHRRSPESPSRPHVSSDEIVAALKSKLAEWPAGRSIPHSDAERNGETRYAKNLEAGNAAARREYEEVEKRYRNTPQWMKAPNGKPTNLTERQWVQVRTPAFKKWFGDWERKLRIEKLRESKSIAFKWRNQFELNRQSARSWALRNLKGEYTNRDTGDVIAVLRDGLRKVTSHGTHSEAHLKSVAAIPEIIENSIFIDERDNDKGKHDYDTYRYYVSGISIDGVDYTAKIVIGVKDGREYYDHNLTQIEKGNLIGRASKLPGPGNEVSPDGAYDTKLLELLQVGDVSSRGFALPRPARPEWTRDIFPSYCKCSKILKTWLFVGECGKYGGMGGGKSSRRDGCFA